AQRSVHHRRVFRSIGCDWAVGARRKLMRPYHEPVMTGEVVRFLNPRPGGTVIDGTVGGGGHALHIGPKLGSDGTLVCVDQDPDALETAREALKNLKCRVILL